MDVEPLPYNVRSLIAPVACTLVIRRCAESERAYAGRLERDGGSGVDRQSNRRREIDSGHSVAALKARSG